MTETNLYVNKCKQSRSYLNHLVFRHTKQHQSIKQAQTQKKSTDISWCVNSTINGVESFVDHVL